MYSSRKICLAVMAIMLAAGSLAFLAPTPVLFFAPMGIYAIWLGMAAIAPSATPARRSSSATIRSVQLVEAPPRPCTKMAG